MKAETADKAGMSPFAPEEWKPDYRIAFKRAAGEASVEKLTIDLEGDAKEPAKMTLNLSWGKHVLTAPVTATLSS